ncbi:hypothetical protein GCM10011360_31770 [Primorskyibacter flagellatus]|uniref:Transglutaminase-like domain-containing protein n=1 Tax=Primorskyibacter flagellatus TaxID=1387277 RepID=A0A917EHR9_9RHOB|nr:transglutaminase family protein [Primorskyibacter flagellatus]GGE41954.1 hypothetical protein GCM10011360_31770 [Primorskyibacter flagellatus]
MTDIALILRIDDLTPPFDGARLVVPAGLATPHAAPVETTVTGAQVSVASDPLNGQHVLVLAPDSDAVTVETRFVAGGPAYPDTMFVPRDSRYTRMAGDLRDDARRISAEAGGGAAGLSTLVQSCAALFSYGHPEQRFYDDTDEVPQICSLTTGSCVDIDLYLIALLRGAGYEAGYVTGYFIPEEKRSHAVDGHCWVVTRHDGVCQEWDIAHHLKMGRSRIEPGLNPKPGVRLPFAHSMGWSLPALGVVDTRLIIPAVWLGEGRALVTDDVTITLRGYDLLG